ncbi:MAG: hypothetical protein Ct9H300mP6_02860 [Gammaproteobacteria bacterium]|nr:MAG: hypothetical protein Ct9H300mP6_02860 [Gammaproteobacteria bacterium]
MEQSEWFLRNKIMSSEIKSIAILGGTGALGSALTKKWANTGYRISSARETQKRQKE